MQPFAPHNHPFRITGGKPICEVKLIANDCTKKMVNLVQDHATWGSIEFTDNLNLKINEIGYANKRLYERFSATTPADIMAKLVSLIDGEASKVYAMRTSQCDKFPEPSVERQNFLEDFEKPQKPKIPFEYFWCANKRFAFRDPNAIFERQNVQFYRNPFDPKLSFDGLTEWCKVTGKVSENKFDSNFYSGQPKINLDLWDEHSDVYRQFVMSMNRERFKNIQKARLPQPCPVIPIMDMNYYNIPVNRTVPGEMTKSDIPKVMPMPTKYTIQTDAEIKLQNTLRWLNVNAENQWNQQYMNVEEFINPEENDQHDSMQRDSSQTLKTWRSKSNPDLYSSCKVDDGIDTNEDEQEVMSCIHTDPGGDLEYVYDANEENAAEFSNQGNEIPSRFTGSNIVESVPSKKLNPANLRTLAKEKVEEPVSPTGRYHTTYTAADYFKQQVYKLVNKEPPPPSPNQSPKQIKTQIAERKSPKAKKRGRRVIQNCTPKPEGNEIQNEAQNGVTSASYGEFSPIKVEKSNEQLELQNNANATWKYTLPRPGLIPVHFGKTQNTPASYLPDGIHSTVQMIRQPSTRQGACRRNLIQIQLQGDDKNDYKKGSKDAG